MNWTFFDNERRKDMAKPEREFCHWCLTPVQKPPKYDEASGEKLVCSPQCWWLEKLFCLHYSDYEIEMRRYFDEEDDS